MNYYKAHGNRKHNENRGKKDHNVLISKRQCFDRFYDIQSNEMSRMMSVGQRRDIFL